ncbi:IS110 family transposase [Niallia circulans]|uniref:IS110 family transposase n=1 Tax=Niallia circulans TaxID=1397 RepID=UPI003D958D46
MKRDEFIYVGVDLHKFQHTAVIVNCWGEKLNEITFLNKPSLFPDFIRFVEEQAEKGITPVYGLEDVNGYGRSLAVYLLERGYIVKSVNPSLSYAERKSHAMTKKSDSWDAECIAEILARKITQLPDAAPSDIYWTISTLVGRRDTLVKQLGSLKNQLHLQLSHHYPSYRQFFSQVEGKTALAFWEKYPSPHHLEGVTMDELRLFLLNASNNSLSTKKSKTILSLVKFDGETKRDYQSQRDFIIQSLVRDIRFKQEEIKRVEKELNGLVKSLGMQLATMTGIDTVTASALISEIGDIHRFSHSNKLARYAGIAPVLFGSGGKETYQKSQQGNRNLHHIFYNLAVQQVQVSKGSKTPRNPVFYGYYQKKLSQGKTNKQALICIMRRLVNIIYGMMKNKTAYIMPEQVEKKAS